MNIADVIGLLLVGSGIGSLITAGISYYNGYEDAIHDTLEQERHTNQIENNHV